MLHDANDERAGVYSIHKSSLCNCVSDNVRRG
jgi:hypothetical protein